MKCPICHGKGRIQDHKYNEEHDIEYLVYCEKKCEYCNGTGEVQMTNEEWLCSLSTEEKVNALLMLHEKVRQRMRAELGGENSFYKGNYYREWLKEIHK